MADIIIRGLSKSFGEKHVFRALSLDFASGKRYLLMGPSGSGKTTLLRMIMGLEKSDGGSISFSETPAFGVVFQEDRLCPGFSALENLRMGASLGREEALDALARLMPDGDPHIPVEKLSGGQRRRVAILRAALAPGRNILILDEPFSGLDDESRRRAGAWLKEHAAGKTVLAVSHLEEDAPLLEAEPVMLFDEKGEG